MPATVARNEELLDQHLIGYVRREQDLYRGFAQGVNVNVNFYTRKINHHRKMITEYAKRLDISQDTIAKTIASMRANYTYA